MAAAVLADIDIYGAEPVAALAVTHADCEALADRIRADLIAQGTIAGPVLEGPGWASVRCYQAGDRIVLHAHVGSKTAAGSPPGPSLRSPRSRRPGSRCATARAARRCCRKVSFPQGRGRPAEGVARVGSHDRRRAGRHLGPGAPACDSGVGPLPRLCRPVPLDRPHPHLEHHIIPGR